MSNELEHLNPESGVNEAQSVPAGTPEEPAEEPVPAKVIEDVPEDPFLSSLFTDHPEEEMPEEPQLPQWFLRVVQTLREHKRLVIWSFAAALVLFLIEMLIGERRWRKKLF